MLFNGVKVIGKLGLPGGHKCNGASLYQVRDLF